MQLATVAVGEATSAARVEGSAMVLLDAADVGELLARPDWSSAAAADGPTVPRQQATLRNPLPRPGKVICVGLNYAAHILEMGRELPTQPTLFAKYASALIGPTDDIVLPRESSLVDWEVELGVVIGQTVRRASPAQAVAAIAGYTVVNDVTARDWQKRTLQWLQGKSWDDTTPVGPVVVTADEVDPDAAGAPDLEVTCAIDGVTRQRSRTADLVFSPAALVAYISTFTTLQPGDLIATGTPDGVGAAQDPPMTLVPGSVVETTVQGIGTLRNVCTAG